MTFTQAMNDELAKPLDAANVKPPAPGKYGEYIEGWKVIEEANRIFGFDGWSRETIEIAEVCRYETEVGHDKKAGWAVGYRAKVRVVAHGVAREGSAVGNGVSVQLYDAIESAAKEAETDAMKRALMTFGYPFGLALYDKSKANVVESLPESVERMVAGLREAADQGEVAMAGYWKQHWPAIPQAHRERVLAIKEELKAGMALVDAARAG